MEVSGTWGPFNLEALTNSRSVLKHQKLIFSQSGGQRPKISFTGTKSRCQQGHIPPEALGENLFLPILPSGGCWHSWTSGNITPIFKISIFKFLSAPSSYDLLPYVPMSNLPLLLIRMTHPWWHFGLIQVIQDNLLTSKSLT